MPTDTRNANHSDEQGARAGRTPAVGVVAPGSGAGRLAAILERSGLTAAEPSAGGGSLDVLVVALESPSSGRDEIRRMQDEHPGARLVLVVEAATPAEARQLLVDDVPGLVLERDTENALALSVRSVAVGQISYPAELMPTELKAALSNREKQILGMLVMGFSNAEIAAKLHVSESTVKSHLYSAFTTLGVGSRKDAVALILDPNAGFGTGILSITDRG